MSNQRYEKKILLTCLRRGAWPIVRVHVLLTASVRCHRGLWTLMLTAVSALRPRGAGNGGADKVHAFMKRPAGAGAARPPAIALLNLAVPGCRHANVHPGESNDRLQLRQNKEGFPLCKDPFKIGNCCKCCRLLGGILLFGVCRTHAGKTWGRQLKWCVFACEESK